MSEEHCGKAWPHGKHEWLPDYPHALWSTCPGSPDSDASPAQPTPQPEGEARCKNENLVDHELHTLREERDKARAGLAAAEQERDVMLAFVEARDRFLNTIYRTLGGQPSNDIATLDYDILERVRHEIDRAEAAEQRASDAEAALRSQEAVEQHLAHCEPCNRAEFCDELKRLDHLATNDRRDILLAAQPRSAERQEGGA